jgi:hypothetical protein
MDTTLNISGKLYVSSHVSNQKMKSSKSAKDLVCFYYQWKRTPRYEPIYSQYAQVYHPKRKMKNIETFTQRNVLSVLPPPTVVMASPIDKKIPDGPCFHCSATDSSVWHKLPLNWDPMGTRDKSMCDPCRVYWQKYAFLRPMIGQQLVTGIVYL